MRVESMRERASVAENIRGTQGLRKKEGDWSEAETKEGKVGPCSRTLGFDFSGKFFFICYYFPISFSDLTPTGYNNSLSFKYPKLTLSS